MQKAAHAKGTRLPPGAFAFSTYALCLTSVNHGYPAARYTSICHVADCVQAD
jgi:hypothetical protein